MRNDASLETRTGLPLANARLCAQGLGERRFICLLIPFITFLILGGRVFFLSFFIFLIQQPRSDCMDPGKSAVSGVANSGVSEPSSNGRKYEWGMHGPQDFAPNGGIYHVCWCVNMATLTCTDIGGDFVLTAGQLTVVGPSPSKNNLQCIRGSYCADLPFEGHSLSTNDRVAVRREECGSMNGLSLSEGRGDGVGQLQASVGEDLTTDAGHSTGSLMYLGFGAFEEEKDNRLTVDAGSGYNLCWCSSERSNCMEPTDFAVAAGNLDTSWSTAISLGMAPIRVFGSKKWYARASPQARLHNKL